MKQLGVSKTNVKERSSMYKTKSRGISDRLVRGIRVQEERKQCRMGKIDERRRMPLSPLQKENQSSNAQGRNRKEGKDAKDHKLIDQRREKLLKWREEKLLRKKAEELENSKKKAFVVKHVSHPLHPVPVLSKPPAQKKSPNPPTKSTGSESMHRVTRSSARLANKATKEQAGENSKSAGHTTQTKKHENDSKRATRSTASKTRKRDPAPERLTNSHRTIKTRSKSKLESKSEPLKEASLKEVEFKLNKATFAISFKRGSELNQSDNERLKTSQETPNFSSFAPSEFSFRAPAGVDSFRSLSKSFAFEPLSPRSAQKFMFPSSTVFDDKPVTMAMVEAKRAAGNRESVNEVVEEKKSLEMKNSENTGKEGNNIILQENMIVKECKLKKMGVDNALSPKRDQSAAVELKENRGQPSNSVCEGEIKGENKGTDAIADMSEASGKKENSKLDVDTGPVREKIDSSNFRTLVETETKRLKGLCALWEEESNGENPLSEEVQGMIRTVIGQVQLLVTKKFKQFRGLIDLSEDPDAERKTLTSDLQGFWDMIYFQVEDIDSKFQKLDELKLNNWEEEKMDVKKVTMKKTSKKAIRKPSKAGTKASEARNKFREMRAQMKAKLREENSCQEAFKLVLTPVKNKKSRVDKGEPEVVLTPLRRSTRKSLSRHPAVVSTPRTEDQPGFQLRLTPTTDEEKGCTESVTNDTTIVSAREELEKSEKCDVLETKKLKDIREVTQQKAAAAGPISECSDVPINTTSAESSSESDDKTQKSESDRQDSTSGNSHVGSSTSDELHSEIVTNGTVSTSDGCCDLFKDEMSLETNGSTRKRRHSKSRVKFTCSPSSDDKAVTPSKRSYQSTPSRYRVSTPFINGIRCTTDDEDALTSGIVTNDCKPIKPEIEHSSENEETENERKKTPRRRSSARKITKRRSSLKKLKKYDIETPLRNYADETEEEGNETPSFHALYLQPSSDSADKQDSVKTPHTSFYSSVRVSQSQLITPTPSKLTKTPMPDTAFTPTPGEKPLALTEKSAETTTNDKNSESGPQSLTPCTLLANFHLNESGNESGLVNDSVFFPHDKPCEQSSAKENVSETANLILFSPTTPSKKACEEEETCGSVRKFAPVTHSKKLESYLGTDAVFSQVRRSARIEATPTKTSKRPAFVSLSEVPDDTDTDIGYVPNKALI